MRDADQAVERGQRQREQVVAAVTEVPAEQLRRRPREQHVVGARARMDWFTSQLSAWYTVSAACPSGYSTAIPMPGTAARSAAAAAASAAGGMRCSASIVSVRMS